MKNKELMYTFILGLFAFLFALSLVAFPEYVVDSAFRGLKIWWEIVFPATLPFFIISEILMGFGVAHFLGVILEPLMRPLFNVPGAGGFTMSMSFASGYPMGAKLTARLIDQKLLSKSEGERLLSFTCTSDPLFMFGAVAVGFFHNASLGITLVVIHYLTSILVGIIMAFYDRKGEKTITVTTNEFIIIRALKAMHRARLDDGRNFGTLMGNAVTTSINTLFLIGGLIIIFSVIIEITTLIKLTSILDGVFHPIFYLAGIPEALLISVNSGFLEVTLGAQVVSEASAAIPMVHKMAVTGGILAWSGLSVHAQVASIISHTGMSYKPYLYARILHTLLAVFGTYVLWEPLNKHLSAFHLPIFLQLVPETKGWNLINVSMILMLFAMIMLGTMIILSLIISLFKRSKV